MNTDDEKGPLKRVPIIKIQSQQQNKDSLCHINLSNLGHVYCSGLELCVINMYLSFPILYETAHRIPLRNNKC